MALRSHAPAPPRGPAGGAANVLVPGARPSMAAPSNGGSAVSDLLEVLRAEGLVDEASVAEADRLRRDKGLPLATALVRAGAATEQQVAMGVARQTGVPYVDTTPGHVDRAAAALLPRPVALELEALPVAFEGDDELVVAMARPGDADTADRIAELTGMRVTPAMTARTDLLRAIEHLADELDTPASAGPAPSADSLLAFEQEAAVDLDEVLIELVESGGSDLHLTAGAPPSIRVRGDVVRLEEYGVLTPPELQKMIYGILTQ